MHSKNIAALVVILLCTTVASQAWAHTTSLKLNFIEPAAGASAITWGSKSSASLNLSSGNGGKIKFKAKRFEDGGGGKITATGNNLVMDVVINGTPQVLQFPFDLVKGNGKISNVFLGLFKPDIIEIIDVTLQDSSANVFAEMGFTAFAGPNNALKSAMVQVEEGSFIRLAPSRDADVGIKAKKGGDLHLRFDKLKDVLGNDINSTGNWVEFEASVNGAAPSTHTSFFDIVNDSGEVDELLPTALGLSAGDSVRILRIDAFDPNGDRFSTLGVRIQNPPAP